jgi:hypothetical protein
MAWRDQLCGATVDDRQPEGRAWSRQLSLEVLRTVALKVLVPELAEDEVFRERFIRESQIAASLDHPNVVGIYEADETDGALYLATQHVEGLTSRPCSRPVSSGSSGPRDVVRKRQAGRYSHDGLRQLLEESFETVEVGVIGIHRPLSRQRARVRPGNSSCYRRPRFLASTPMGSDRRPEMSKSNGESEGSQLSKRQLGLNGALRVWFRDWPGRRPLERGSWSRGFYSNPSFGRRLGEHLSAHLRYRLGVRVGDRR